MNSKLWGMVVATALALPAAAVPVATAAGLSDGITIETSAGPVTCAPDPANEPGPGAISAIPFAHGEKIAITETGALRCQIPALGEVEVTGAGLPWTLIANESRLTARLKGTRKPGIQIHPVGFPSLSCLYEAGKVLGTLLPGNPPSVSLTVNRAHLKKSVSSTLCPALGPIDLDLTLP